MRLFELSDTQVAGAFINQDPNQRRQDNSKTPQQLARDQGAQLAADRASKDPLKMRIAQLRQQLAQLILQDQKKTADAQRQQGQQGTPPAQPQASPPQGNQQPAGTP